ncbi:MAG: hypothetical protein AABZ39_06210 [Spirochaetota bacterium]
MDGRVVYLFRWTKNDKPEYQSGEIVMLGEKRYMPRAPDSFQSLANALQMISRKYQSTSVMLLTMGLTEPDTAQLNAFLKNSTFISNVRDITRPTGKRKDGSPSRVFLIGTTMDVLKEIKNTLIREHFEIVGMAKAEAEALRTIYRMNRNLDLILIECSANRVLQEETITSIRGINAAIRVLSFGAPGAAPLSGHGHITAPYTRDTVVAVLKKLFA